jgi:ribosomal protein S18 acetylase RimI-like enzyme
MDLHQRTALPSALTSTLQYESLHYKLVHKIFHSSSLVTPDYTVIYDKKDDYNFTNIGGILTLTEKNYREKIQEIESKLRAEKRKPTLYITPDATPCNLSELAQGLGYRRSFVDAWMFYEGKPTLEIPKDVSIRTVNSMSEMKRFVEIFNRVFSGTDPSEPYGKAPDAWGENLIDSYGKTDPSLQVKYYILQDHGEDAAIILSVSDGERAGLYSIGTVPKRRRRGLSTIATVNAVNELQAQGVSEIFLITEKDTYNEKFYKGIGFNTRWYATGWSLE